MVDREHLRFSDFLETPGRISGSSQSGAGSWASGVVTLRVFQDLEFSQVTQLLNPGDLLVVNNTRVLPARMMAYKSTGGKVEIMLERLLDAHNALVLLGANKPVKIG